MKKSFVERHAHYSRWDLHEPTSSYGKVLGRQSKRLATGLDSGQKHAGMTARGFYMSPLRDLFQSRGAECAERISFKIVSYLGDLCDALRCISGFAKMKGLDSWTSIA